MEEHPEIRILEQDNAHPHLAQLILDFLADQEITPMDWLPYSPDFNPMEQLWDIFGRRVAERNQTTRNQLVRFLQEEWVAKSLRQIQNLISNMRERYAEYIEHRGGHTHY
jgi:transposase